MIIRTILFLLNSLFVSSVFAAPTTFATSEKIHQTLERRFGKKLEPLPILSSFIVNQLTMQITDRDLLCELLLDRAARSVGSKDEQRLPTAGNTWETFYVIGIGPKAGPNSSVRIADKSLLRGFDSGLESESEIVGEAEAANKTGQEVRLVKYKLPLRGDLTVHEGQVPYALTWIQCE